MKYVFRVDASLEIGTGHIMRCLTLADELTRQGHKCEFVCREHQGHMGDFIVGKGYSLTLLPMVADNDSNDMKECSSNYIRWLGVSWKEDARQTLKAIKSNKPDWLIIDHYALDADWERVLSSFVERIMVIDDLANRTHNCRLLLDQNLGRKFSDYDGLIPVNCERLIGPVYALLRPEFAMYRDQSLSRRLQPELKRILISLGGVDRSNITGLVLEALSRSTLPSSIELDIVMGASAPHLKTVIAMATDLRFCTEVNINVTDIAERMCSADVAIGAAGSTSWERCCMGLPTIMLEIASNQKMVHKSLVASGAALALEVEELRKSGAVIISDLFKRLNSTSAAMSLIAANLTDGLGCTRVVKSLKGI